MHKLVRITTVPISLRTLLRGQLKFMSKNGFEVIGVSSSGKELADVSKEEGIRVFALEMTRKITPINDFLSLWKFYRFCKKEKPDIVHSHTPKAGLVAMVGAKLAGVPIRLHTVAGLPLMEAKGIKRKLLLFVEKIVYYAATNVYPNSIGLYNFILENKLSKHYKLKVIGNGSSNGINTEYFSPIDFNPQSISELKARLKIKEDDFVFVFVGRLVGDKGVNELVKAFKKLKNFSNTKRVKLLLVGAFENELDPLDSDTLNIIETCSDILSVGFQNDVRPYFMMSNALVFPSYREGFPNVVMQAGSMGLPSIVTNINGCNEIISDYRNGIIIPPKDVDSLYEAMMKILKDKTLYEKIKSNSRPFIQINFEQKEVWEAMLVEYNHLIS